MNYVFSHNASLELSPDGLLNLFLKEYETRQADAAATFYRYISGMSDAASLQGHVFERQALNHLGGIDPEHKLSIRWLASENAVFLSWFHSMFRLSAGRRLHRRDH